MEQCLHTNKCVTMSLASFDNWLNDIDIKIDRLIADCDKEEPIDLNILFPEKDLDRVMSFGVDFVLEIIHYLYVNKHNGHIGTGINLGFIEEK